MYKKYLVYFSLATIVFGQTSLAEINNFSDINNEIQKIKDDLNSDIKEELVEKAPINEEIETVILSSKNEEMSSQFFGYDYFSREINFFDNIPAPADYKIGPGDELILSLWGESNLRQSIIVNKNGLIYFDNIGFINVSNMNLDQAELLLSEKLSKIYETINSAESPTYLGLELGKIKSLNVYFTGHFNQPGINLIHPFSDLFSAIVQAGGIHESGSLRKISLIRNGKVILETDFYSFFINGDNSFKKNKILDGDIIHVPSISNRVKIDGEVFRPSSYEILDGENLIDLINFASGLRGTASSTAIVDKVFSVFSRESDDYAKTSLLVKINIDGSNTLLSDGDSVKINKTSDVKSFVRVYGNVKNPGLYPGKNYTLKQVLDVAGGFDDPFFRKSILDEIEILRKDNSQLFSKTLKVNYSNADSIMLMPEDKIFVYENINYRNNFTYRVEGEINKPGTYPLKKDITIGQAIKTAGGLTELGNNNNILVKQEFTDVDEEGNETTNTQNVANASLNFILSQNSIINVLPYENVVSVEGNVYNAGLVAFEKGMTMNDAIIQAGGYKPYSLKKRSYVKKSNGEISKANIFRGRTKRLNPGDTVVVPKNPNPSDFDITSFIADLSTTLANIAAILIVIENNTD